MRSKFIGIPLGALLLVAGATAVLAQSGGGAAIAQATSGAAAAVTQAVGGPGSLLADVLDDLVGDGTITQDQADAIVDAVEERRTDLREQAEALREQLRTFLADGTLSADELAQLPEDHPLRNLDQFLEDGQLTQDELQQLRGLGGFGFHGRGHGGPGLFGGPGRGAPVDPDASPEASPEAEGSSTST